MWVSESGHAASYEVASQGKGIHPNEVSQIEIRYQEEQSSKLHLTLSVSPSPSPSPSKPSTPINAPHQTQQQQQAPVSTNLPQTTNEITQDVFAYNIALNKKLESERKQKGYVSVESTQNVVINSPGQEISVSQVEQKLNNVNQELASVDLTKQNVDLFQYNIKLNQKINLDSELKKSGSQAAPTPAPVTQTTLKSSGAPLKSSGAPLKSSGAPLKSTSATQKPNQPPPGYIAQEIETVVGKQVFFVKVDGISKQNEQRFGGPKVRLLVDSQNLPLAAYSIVLMAGARSQFPIEKSNQTQLVSETSKLSGFSAIARYIARKFDSLNLYSKDPSLSSEVKSISLLLFLPSCLKKKFI